MEAWDRESCNLHIRCREKSEETHVSALASRATAKDPSESRTSRLGLTHSLFSVSSTDVTYTTSHPLRRCIVTDRSLGLRMHVRDVQHARQPRFRCVIQKKTGTFTFLSEVGNPYLNRVYKVYKELTRTLDILSAPSTRRQDWSSCGVASCRSSSRTYRTSSKDSILNSSRLEIDEGFRTFWAILQDEGQTDLDTESRATDHPQGPRWTSAKDSIQCSLW